MLKRTARFLCWSLIALCPGVAFADARAVVRDFKGPSAKQVRSAVVDVLEDNGVELVPPRKASKVARSSGADLDTESGRVRVARKLRVQAFIEGRTRAHKRRIQVKITVYGGSDGMQASDFTATASKAAVVRDVKAKLWSAISSALNASEPVEEVASAPEPAKPSRSAPAPSRPAPVARADHADLEDIDEETPPGIAGKHRDDAERESSLAEQADQGESDEQRPSALDFSIGARFGTRSFGYNESLPGLRGYSLGFSPSAALRAHWYPAAHFGDGVLAHLGLDVRADFLIGVSSKNSEGETFSNSSHAFGVGLRARVPLGKVELGAVGGFGQHTFGFASESGKVDPDIPDVSYNFVRLGLDGKWQFAGPLTLQLGAAYLLGLSQGEIADRAWFPHTKGNGVEAELGLAIPTSRLLAFELMFGMQRYFLSLNPDPKDPGVVGTKRVAGGALDQYWSTRLGIVFRL